MKKITMLTLAVTACTFSFAQIGKGSLMLGGTLNMGENNFKSYFNQSTNRVSSSFYEVSPSFGYAIRENLFAGVGGGYSANKYWSVDRSNIQQDSRRNGWSAFIFLRKYATLGKSFYLFAEPALYYNNERTRRAPTTYQPFITDIKNTAVGLSLYPGISYAVNRKLHLEIGLNRVVDFSYGHQEETNKSLNGQPTSVRSVSRLNLATNINPANALSIGARFILAR